MELNKIYQGNSLKVLRTFPPESVNSAVFSQPYYSLRDYSTEPQIWDGDLGCKHEWGNVRKTLRHKSGKINSGKEYWSKNRGASDEKGNSFCRNKMEFGV